MSHFIKTFFFNLLKYFTGITLTLILLYQTITIDLPDPKFLAYVEPGYSSYMVFDPILDEKGLKSINYTRLSQVSPYVIKAVLTAEDDQFFDHNGFAWKQIQQAFLYNYNKKRYAHGASTLTQQLARNLFLSKSKTLLRKLRESILTYKLERSLSKKRILELYLNYAEFGPGIYGISAASEYHFHTDPAHINPSQAALLAAVLPNPKYYGKKPYPSRLVKRQNLILNHMNRFGVQLPSDLFDPDTVITQKQPESNTKQDLKSNITNTGHKTSATPTKKSTITSTVAPLDIKSQTATIEDLPTETQVTTGTETEETSDTIFIDEEE